VLSNYNVSPSPSLWVQLIEVRAIAEHNSPTVARIEPDRLG
jgi:hypothetical protein